MPPSVKQIRKQQFGCECAVRAIIQCGNPDLHVGAVHTTCSFYIDRCWRVLLCPSKTEHLACSDQTLTHRSEPLAAEGEPWPEGECTLEVAIADDGDVWTVAVDWLGEGQGFGEAAPLRLILARWSWSHCSSARLAAPTVKAITVVSVWL